MNSETLFEEKCNDLEKENKELKESNKHYSKLLGMLHEVKREKESIFFEIITLINSLFKKYYYLSEADKCIKEIILKLKRVSEINKKISNSLTLK